ncbi:hypothetical protein P4637_20670 [Halalkalibacterium halodurans]|nr:hypothetical protein [Halalkalibacterium halodurans]MED4087228.1 hypothetical protein [Halalkalibacterium halodurans]MED4106938.1 hypothetical protein [Halalkalibacterium halodurans]MED4111024.1 hypothetical protein [Halalkalibacterium halodurans]MED4151034.1 hypothetical protein [Halalkalibacterium halodurans]
MPEEIVYDQDALISVSENAGDLLFTAEFDKYRKFRDFQIYLCRKSDPESKGKVEQVVKFVKNNFLKSREFKDIEALNHQATKWLERTGNHKVHHNTKKRPSEVYTLERKHLRKVSSKFSFENTLKPIITRTVQKDNVIRFESNRYSVPIGTYDKRTKNIVYIEITQDDHLLVRLQEDGEVIARHVISSQKGQLIQDSSHIKRPSTKKDKLRKEIETTFKDRELISWFLDELHVKYPRHLLDQLKVLSKVIDNHPTFIDDALEKVKLLNLISANDFRDIAYSLHVEAKERIPKAHNKSDKYSHLKAAERSEDYYVNVLTGGKKS